MPYNNSHMDTVAFRDFEHDIHTLAKQSKKKHMLHHIPIDILVVFRAVLVQEKLEISLKKKLLILELNLYQYQNFLMDQCLLLIVNKQEKRKTKENC